MTTPLKKTFFVDPVIGAFWVTLGYLIYLGLSTQMVIAFDSIGYERLAKILYQNDWIGYFKDGPNREPLYPFVISFSMRLADLGGVPYQTILRFIQIAILVLTQVLTLWLLGKFQIRPIIKALTILYIGISPALVNSALSMYSEIVAYPLILGALLISVFAWQSLDRKNDPGKIALYGMALAVSFALLTLTKGICEVIFPVFLLPFIYLLVQVIKKKDRRKTMAVTAFLLTAFLVYYSVIQGYKSLNEKYNGNFVLTDRGAWPLYGNTSRRMDDLTARQFLVAMAYVPGEGFCQKLFKEQECRYWSYRESDRRGMSKLDELTRMGLSGEEIKKKLMELSFQEILKNPFQYAFFMLLEALKMFFWESTRIGWVVYPAWLTGLFNFETFKNFLRLTVSVLSLFSFVFIAVQLFKKKREPANEEKTTLFFIFYFITLFVGSHTFFFTLTRYSLPIAPLFVILLAVALSNITSTKSRDRGD